MLNIAYFLQGCKLIAGFENGISTSSGRDVSSVANEYGIHENTLWKWKRQYTINPEAAFHGEPVLTAQEAQERELQQLRRRIRELEQENDFLKKVSAYFAKNPR